MKGVGQAARAVGGVTQRPSWRVVLREARDLLWVRRGRMAVGLVLLLVGRAAGLVLPASTKFVIDEVIGKGRGELLVWIGLAAGAGVLIQAVSSLVLAWLLGVTAQRSITELRRRLQRHVGRLPLAYFEAHKSGELISRVLHDADGVRNLVGMGFVQMVGGIVSSGLAFAVLLWLDWRLTLAIVGYLAAFAVVMVIGFDRLRPLFRERGRLLAALSGRLAESLGGIRVVKAYTAEMREARTFTRGVHRLLRNAVKSLVGVATVGAAASLLFGLAGVTLALLGARAVLDGRMTVGDLFSFVMFTGLMVSPLIQVAAIGTQVTEAFAGLDRIREVFSETDEFADDPGRAPVGSLAGEVVFEGVTFSYDPRTPVLRGVDFEAPAGSVTALVGPSGAGKSTVLSLLLGFRRPDGGSLRVDGRELSSLRLGDYRKFLAVVLQDDFLFDGTLIENIAYGRPGASRAEVEEAGRLAHCQEFVETFEAGYDTVIGERGVKLSGGQRQRLTIARALLADPRILLLDEATSSLDSESEAAVQEGLATLMRGRTTFVIAHRLSTVRNADQILFLEEGRVVERGTHDELIALGGRFRELYDRQLRVEADRLALPS